MARTGLGSSNTKGERMSRRFLLGALAVLMSVLVAGCGGGGSKSSENGGETGGGGAKKKVTLQLKWVKQAQFGIDWLPSLLAARDQGQDLVNIAQVFGKSGMTELTWKNSGITTIPQMRGKKVGVWCCGNENELYAALNKNGMNPKSDVTIVNQPFDMNLFLNKQVDAAAAMTYNELAQVLETKNPKTGQLYKPSDLNIISMESVGTGMLEDGVFVRGDWISNKDNQETAKKFLAASFKGWVYCRDHVNECTQIVLNN